MALAPQQFCVRWNSYHTNLQAVFPRLLSTEHFADVTLACESQQLKCHKLVLSACSAYFERLLVQNPCKHPIVFMKDMRFSEMQALVDFMYKGEVNVTQDELPSLLKSAEALQIRGLCSGDTSGLTSEANGSSKGADSSKDYTVASEALLHGQTNNTTNVSSKSSPSTNGAKKRKSEEESRASTSADVKQETVEEDGLYYGDIHHDHMDYNEDEEPGKAGSSLNQPSASNFLRVKPESELYFQNQLKNLQLNEADFITKLSKMSASEMQNEFAKYGFSTSPNSHTEKSKATENVANSENDFYKSWLEQNGELEVSLLRASDKIRKPKLSSKNEVELIPKIVTKNFEDKNPSIRRRGRPPIFKDKQVDLNDAVLKSDLDQFLEGKEVSSSGLSRKDLERVMMGKYNPNRRYSNEAMWAALMDVKKGGSIYRAAQTHKVPRKSLRNWMKRCQIKSSFPMPQQLKQFVENSKRQKEFVNTSAYDDAEEEFDFAIANVQCQYDSPSDTEFDSTSDTTTTSVGVVSHVGDHNYDAEPPAFIIKQVNLRSHNVNQGLNSHPFVEVAPKIMTLGPSYVPSSVNVIHVESNRQEFQEPPPIPPECNKRIRRSEVVLKQAADCVSRGLTFQMVSEQFNIPISTIRFFMARKGILPRRRRGRNSNIITCTSPEPPYHMQHYKLPNMVSLKSDGDEDSNEQK